MHVAGKSVVRANSSEVVSELALAGAGIALRSISDVGDMLREGRLVRVLEPYQGTSEVSVLAVRPASVFVPPTVTAFVAFPKDWLVHLHHPLWPQAVFRKVVLSAFDWRQSHWAPALWTLLTTDFNFTMESKDE